MFLDKRSLHITILFIACSFTVGSYIRNSSRVCDKSKFECDSGQCINEEKLCDGTQDCLDGSDETKDCVNIIPCSSHFLFQCDYGACINKKRQCDGKMDCKDGSDESEIACGKCRKDKFKCGSGECIDKSFICDGIVDCNDKSDETQSECDSTVCPRYSFRCNYGACIVKRYTCNGINDCADGSDEKSCNSRVAPSSSGRGKFQCSSGEFIDEQDICDGIGHCQDNSDETSKLCGDLNCPLYTYRCKYGACVNRNARCNGNVDCVDASDENGCYFEKNFEQGPVAKPYCHRDEFKCKSGKCIKEESVCDGKKDCDDGSEEIFEVCAYRRCAPTFFTCSYGACVPRKSRCDGIFDCTDASDEHGCSEQIPALTPTLNSGCVIPLNSEFGSYQIANVQLAPGQVAPPYSVLIPKCNKGYGITPPEELFSVCVGGKWTPDPQNCTRSCPLIEATTSVECKFNNKPLKTCNNAVQGTVALIQCDTGSDGVVKSIVNFCRDGLWNSPVNQCIPTSTSGNSSHVNIFYIFNNDKNN